MQIANYQDVSLTGRIHTAEKTIQEIKYHNEQENEEQVQKEIRRLEKLMVKIEDMKTFNNEEEERRADLQMFVEEELTELGFFL